MRRRLIFTMFDSNKGLCAPPLTVFFRSVWTGLAMVGVRADTWSGADPRAPPGAFGETSVCWRSPGMAVVGTRHPTPYGSGMAERLAIDLSARGLAIFSGMARGVDHRGASRGHRRQRQDGGGSSARGWTCSIPRRTRGLAEQIVAMGGALISEFPIGTFAAPQNFPLRNRMISGMSVGVLVVEAAEYSGTSITARRALEQNRDVFAVPGNVTNKNSRGRVYADQARCEVSGDLGRRVGGTA
jgi:DNA processing protein